MSETEPLDQYEESIDIDASPAVVWDLVTAMERYGEWSSENTGGYWRKNAEGVPGTGRVGDEFVGINRRADQEWKALVEIDERVEGKSFAFITGGTANNWVYWRYVLEPVSDGTRLTEQWALRNPSPPMIEKGQEEIDRRTSNAKESLHATLLGMKAEAERREG
jgi:hypothetical protein